MKKIDSSYISSSVGQPIKKGTFDLWRDALLETADSIVKAIVDDPTAVVILYGCENSTVAPNYTISAGAVYYNGEVYLVDATTFTAAGTAVATIDDQPITSASADPVLFSDGNSHSVHRNRKVKISDASSGSGIADFANFLSVKTPKFYVPTLNNTYFTTLGNGIRYWKQGNYVYIQGRYSTVATSGSQKTLITLPSGFRPPDNLYITLYNETDAAIGFVKITAADGTIKVDMTGSVKDYNLGMVKFSTI